MTKSLHVSEDILPIGDFKTQAGRVLLRLREGGRPVVITLLQGKSQLAEETPTLGETDG